MTGSPMLYEESLSIFRKSVHLVGATVMALTATALAVFLAVMRHTPFGLLQSLVLLPTAFIILAGWSIVLRRQRYRIFSDRIQPATRPIGAALRREPFVVVAADIQRILIVPWGRHSSRIRSAMATLKTGRTIDLASYTNEVGSQFLQSFLNGLAIQKESPQDRNLTERSLSRGTAYALVSLGAFLFWLIMTMMWLGIAQYYNLSWILAVVLSLLVGFFLGGFILALFLSSTDPRSRSKSEPRNQSKRRP